MRSLLVKQQTMLANATRGLTAKFGPVAPQGMHKLRDLIAQVKADDGVPQKERQALLEVADQNDPLTGRIALIERGIVLHVRHDETARRLVTIRGIGPITATVADIGAFKSGRHFAAWRGLVPPQNSTGGNLDFLTGRSVEQCRRPVDAGDDGPASAAAGYRGASQQDGAHRLGADDAQGDLPAEGADRARGVGPGTGSRAGACPVDPTGTLPERDGMAVIKDSSSDTDCPTVLSSTRSRLVPVTQAHTHHGQGRMPYQQAGHKGVPDRTFKTLTGYLRGSTSEGWKTYGVTTKYSCC